MSKATTISNAVAIATIVDVLRLRAETQRDEIAYRFLADGEEERGTLTYGELYSRARRVAAELQKQSGVGQRALLLDSSEADYIVTFFGCLCAGVIAVPIYAPRLNKKGNARVESVVTDAQPSVVLTAGAVSPGVRDVITASAGKHVKWIDTKALPVDGDELWTPPVVRGTDIAFLQYTSGSTAAPKGVMVSHANILHNEGMIQNAFDTKPGSVIVGWLPLFHDMGLIGNVLQPLYAGVPCILMSPVAFLQRPLRWLQAISRYQATTSGGPNFAYELCMRKVRPEDRSGLDLSSWRVAFNGAEPVRLETVNRFAAEFADCGFRREAFVPCYGLAEATLFVSGGLDPNGVTTVNHGANGNSNNGGLGKEAKISRKQGKLLVACGRPPVEQAVRIVSPDSLRPCSTGDVGEIWISGPSVAQGYWQKAKETEETFKARIPEIDEGPFLRTGDLGFLKDGHLFITGPLKDLLIIRGQNYYPQDIELTVGEQNLATEDIEAALLEDPSIKECAVTVWNGPDSQKQLTAYLVSTGSWEPDRYRKHLRDILPAVMVPSAYVPLARLPLTQAGDIDLKALAQVPVVDPPVISRWEKRLSSAPDIAQAAIVAHSFAPENARLHLADLISGWNSGALKNSGLAQEPAQGSISETREEQKRTAAAFADGGPLSIPNDAPKTFTEALFRTAERYPNKGILHITGSDGAHFQSYPALLEDARRILGGLHAKGLKAGDRVILQCESLPEHFSCFWACVLGGITPVNVAVPPSYADRNGVVNKLYNVWKLLEGPALIGGAVLTTSLPSLEKIFPGDKFKVLSVHDLLSNLPTDNIHPSRPEDLVFLQLTSGSTGTPKCIQESHCGVIAHIHASAQFNAYSPDDVVLNWLPVDHVVPTLMINLKNVYLGCQEIQIATNLVLSKPLCWLDAMETHRVTHSWAPNFGYKLIADALAGTQDKHWDLSSVKFLIIGGEQVTLPVVSDFLERTAPFGITPSVMQPAFGMAEVCTGVTYVNDFNINSGVHWFLKSSLSGALQPAAPESSSATAFVSLGPPMPGVQIRITDEQNNILPEGRIGRCQIKGSVVTRGYLLNDAANRESFVGDGWFNSGDAGFIWNGRLTLTGREKEMIIIRGANFYAYEIEEVVNGIPGTIPTFSAATAVTDPLAGTEGLAVFFVPQTEDSEQKIRLISEIRKVVASNLGISPAFVVPLTRSEFAKTTSGKIQRNQMRRSLESGGYNSILKEIDLALENENTLPGWFYQKLWRPKKIKTVPVAGLGRTVVFLDALGLGARVCEKMAHFDRACITVCAGAKFEQIEADHFQFNPADPEDYRRLFSTIVMQGTPIAQVLHLATYCGAPRQWCEPDHLDSSVDENLIPMLYLIQGLNVLPESHRPIRLLVMSSHSQSIRKGDKLDCTRGAVMGLLKTASQEFPWLQWGHVDLPGDSVDDDVDLVLMELQAQEKNCERAWRDGRRWVPRLQPVDFKRTSKSESLPFKQGGFYLMTGGLGGIGTHIARYLLSNYQARILIVGRTSLHSQPEPSNGKVGEKRKVYEELGRLGCVDYRHVDVSDSTGLAAAVADAKRRWNAELAGIIHLAGVYQERALVDETKESLDAVLRPKLQGSLALHSLIAHSPQALFLSFGSVNGFLGGFSFGGYSVANAFLDSLTDFQRELGLHSYCLNWSLWEETGMSRGLATKEAGRARGYYSIAQEQGVHSMLAVLGRDCIHPFIGLDASKEAIRQHCEDGSPELRRLAAYCVSRDSAVDVTELGRSLPLGCKLQLLERMPTTGSGEIDRDELARLARSKGGIQREFIKPRTALENQIAQIWQGLLGIRQIGIQDNFFELGGHSLLATQVISRIREVFHVELPLPSLFQSPTVAGLALQVDRAAGTAAPPLLPLPREQSPHLSFAQERLWFLSRYEAETSLYNMPVALQLRGPLNREALHASLQEIVARHEVLRTSFPETDGMARQNIASAADLSMPVVEMVESEMPKFLLQQARLPFDLATGPLIRTCLLQLGNQDHVLLMVMHHIVSDGWSLGVMLREFNVLYDSFSRRVVSPLPPLPIQYADYSGWQREWLQGEVLERQLDYWKKQLAGHETLNLPTDRPHPAKPTLAGATEMSRLPGPLLSQLKLLSHRQGVTLFMTLLAGFEVLLYRYTGQTDISVGSAIANRSRQELEPLIGFFVNTLVLRTQFTGDSSVAELLQRVRDVSLQAYAHQDIPFERLVEALDPVRELGRTPFFQVLFALQNAPLPTVSWDGLEATASILETGTAKFDLFLSAREEDGELELSLEYRTELFNAERMKRLLQHYRTLLEGMVVSVETQISELEMLSEAERWQLLVEWNRTEAPYPSDKCVHQLFEEQAARTPQAVAVIYEEERLSYGELNERANRLAWRLRDLGVGPETIVGLMVERSIEMVVALLGVLKAGGAYVPMDPGHPRERLRFMVEDTQAAVVLTQTRFAEPMRGSSAHIICVEDEWDEITRESDRNPEGNVGPGNLAYVIYTSGSTGRPKGVMVPHRAINRLVLNNRYAKFEASDRVAFASNPAFDAATMEVWAPLLNGGSIAVIDQSVLLDATKFGETLKRQAVNILWLTVGLFNQYADALAEQFSGLRYLIVGGDALDPRVIGRVIYGNRPQHLLNGYGPTETTTFAITHEVNAVAEKARSIPIGRPIANTRAYILGEQGEPTPIGVAGELYIGGEGLARGYLNRTELTAERFVPDPFTTEAGARIYKTGDLARWQADGNIDFVGRNDNQVKIRGFRIELGEIETRLAEYPEVREAVVLAREDEPGDKRLVAYYTASGMGKAEAASVGAEQLRAHLSAVVPDYMVPAAYVRMERLPLTPNGKLDRKALPAPEQEAYAVRRYEAPVGEMETKLAAVWAEVLKLEKVGRHDNFFQLGGHSLLATRVVSRIREGFHVELPIHSLFQNPTVAGLALQVAGAAITEAPPLRAVPREQSPRLSFAQERLWFLSCYEAEASLYNIPVALRLRGPLNREALHAGLQEIVARHEVLRTSFPETDGTARQNISSTAVLSMPVFEMAESEMPEFLQQQARLPFDLATGPLIRGCLLELGNQDHVLLVVMHHIVSDGWSLGVMLREFNALYDAFSRGAASPLQPLAIQYADYSEWQREWLQGEVLERQLDYWRKQLAGHETLSLPTDRSYSAKPTLAGAMERSRLSKPLLSQLKSLSDQQGVTLFMTLLAGFEVLLYRYTGQTDISVGSAIANRSRQELEPLIGFFVNTLVLRTQFTGDSSVVELLQRVRDVSLQAYAHQDIPFERLVEALDPVRDLGRTPFFQALFALQNVPLPKVTWNGLEATVSIVETGTAKFDLTLSTREEDGELELSLEYRTELFNAERMRRLLQHYRTLLEGIAVSVETRISELEMLSEPEEQQLLVEWHGTESPYWTDKCVHQLFEEQAARAPQAVAVVEEDREISYAELNRRANQLAHYLVKMGVVPEVRVGICSDSKLEMAAAQMGILKAGGACVPLDQADPATRRNYMLKDAGAKIVLTNERLAQQMAGCADHVVDLEKAREEIGRQIGDNLNVNPDAENLAWVIYTSSSTGRTKGMAIPHRSAVSVMQPKLIDAIDQNPSVERLLNLYAPTEDTTGRSQSNTRAYVLDGHMKLAPVGIQGELYLGGAGQARGYLNRPELTAEKFVPNPFSKTSGERLYRTGDLVRYQENGNLEFLGRLDDQVKIQGYRIEPGEIEAAVLDYPGVTQAAVITRENKPGNLRLVGYVAGSEQLDVDGLRSHLQQHIPEYMVPAALLQLDTMPLTANGKVDRKALIELESKEAMEDAGSLPLTPTEELIAGVWSSLLEKSEIRRGDNFFALGGHSLTSIQMLARVEKVFHREIESPAIFEFPVLKDFSAYVDQLTGPAQLATLRPIVPASRDGRLPLSFAQQRLWFLGQIEGASAAYHIPFGLHLKGDLSRTALRRALDRIVVRHEALRTTFALLDGEPVQEIGAVEESSFCLLEHDLRGHNDVEAELAALRELEARASFDLEAGPLIRGRLIRLAEDEHVLLVTMHHIVSDGWSLGVLVRELNALYRAFSGGGADPLPELQIQYADYAVWQRQWIEGEILQQQAAYWKTTLAGAPALLELPTDHERPEQQDYKGGSVEVELDEELTTRIKGLSGRQGTTPYMTLLGSWAALMGRLSGQQEVVIGSPVANRGRAEIENLIGFFVNTVALRVDLGGRPTVKQLLERVKEQVLGAQQHQDMPFEQVVEQAQPERSLGHSPVFQVMLAWQHTGWAKAELAGLKVERLPLAEHRVAQFDLTLSLREARGKIIGSMVYAKALWERKTAERYAGYWHRLVEGMAADEGAVMDSLEVLGEEEREQLLYGWNTTKEYGHTECVHEMFEEQVRRTPNAVAVVCGSEELTYQELNWLANRLGHYLRHLGVKPEERVAICVERGVGMVVGLLGILKAGGAYVPVDPAYPKQLQQYILEAAATRFFVTQRSVCSDPLAYGRTVIRLDQELEQTAQITFGDPEPLAKPENLAYVLHRGRQTAFVEHHTIGKRLRWLAADLDFVESDSMLHRASLADHNLVRETFLPLLHGARIVITDKQAEADPARLRRFIERYRITIAHLPSSILSALMHARADARAMLATLRCISCTGPTLKPAIVEEILQNSRCALYHHYVPFPAAMEAACLRYEVHQEHTGDSLAGNSTGNLSLYVLDEGRRPVPTGVNGEIYVGGQSLPRTGSGKERVCLEGHPEINLLSTGDIGCRRDDGRLEISYCRGRYAWLGEQNLATEDIEAALLEDPSIKECAVTVWNGPDSQKQLTAYLVSIGSWEPDRYRKHLQDILPAVMVPSAYVPLARLPLTQAGDIDLKALAQVPVVDPPVISHWEKRLSSAPAIAQAAIVAHSFAPENARLHLADLISSWKSSALKNGGLAPELAPASISESTDEQKPTAVAFADGGPLSIPNDAPKTFTEALFRTAERYPNKGILHISGSDGAHFQSYPALLEDARRILGGLHAKGLKAGDRVILQCESLPEHFSCFWACVLGGITPVNVAVPPSYADRNGVVNKLYNVWKLLEGPALIGGTFLTTSLPSLEKIFPGDKFKVLSVHDLLSNLPTDNIHPSRPEDLVFLQLTSGSTGTPKCIQESHCGVIAHIYASAQFNAYSPDDVVLNWLPVDHVVPTLTMNLKDVYLGCQEIQIATNLVLSRPLCWLDAIDAHRVTHSWAPNFGFKLIADALAGTQDKHWDLSSVKFLMNAGEQVTLPVVSDFLERTAPFGITPSVMQPAFGMAEVCTCMTYVNDFNINSGVHWFLKSSLSGALQPAAPESSSATAFVDLGPPVPGVQIRITDAQNNILPEGRIGRFQIKGSVVTRGYLLNDAANRESFVGDGWFNSGDLGFIWNGRLTLTGREKEMIIIRGANFYAYEIEEVVNGIPGTTPTFSAATAVTDPLAGTEGLAVFFVPQTEDSEERVRLVSEVRKVVASNLGISPAFVVPLTRSEFAKTTSGKIQRNQMRRSLESGGYNSILKEIDLALENENTLPGWFYQKLWRPRKIKTVPVAGPGRTVVFLDALGLGARVCEKMAHFDQACIMVRAGAKFEQIEADRFQLNPADPEDYRRLFSTIVMQGTPIAQVLHLATYCGAPRQWCEPDHLDSSVDENLIPMLYLIQGLNVLPESHRPIRLLVMSSHSQSIKKDDKLDCTRGAVTGLLKTASQEFPWLQWGHVDLPGDSIDDDVDLVLMELQAPEKNCERAWRDGRRWVPRLQPVDFSRTSRSESLPFKQGGFYLMTGGLGGIGTHFARYLLSNYQARILIVGRTSLDTQPESPNTNGKVDEKRKVYEELESLGCVDYRHVDVSDSAGLAAAVADAKHRWNSELAGIIHLAGVYQERALVDETKESFDAVLRPKFQGSVALHKLIAHSPQALFLSFGSVNGFLGGFSVGAYSVANAFLDSLTDFQRELGLRSYCLNWSLWEETGMSRGLATKEAARARGYYSIAQEQGVHSMLAVLGRDCIHPFIGLDASKEAIRQHCEDGPPELRRLAAYCVSRDSAVNVTELGRSLPLGCKLQLLERMPTTASREIDRDELARLARSKGGIQREFIKPRTALENQIAQIWQGLLGIRQIGIQDNFFELGGHSLLATQVVARVRELVRTDVAVGSLFVHPSLEKFAEAVGKQQCENGSPYSNRIQMMPRPEEIPLSFAQQRLWFLAQMEGGSEAYHIPFGVRLKGELDRQALRQAMDRIVARHEALRTRFVMVEGEPRQRIAPAEQRRFELLEHDLRQQGEQERAGELNTLIQQEGEGRFDLEKGPLIRGRLIRLAEDEHVLLVTMHHIVSDGWSMGVLAGELNALYRAFLGGKADPLPELEIQYADYAVWQRQWMEGEILQQQAAYWKTTLAGAPALLELPTDRVRPVEQSYAGAMLPVVLEEKLTSGLKGLSRSHGTTLYMTLLAGWSILLMRLSGQHDVVIGSPVANRGRTEIENLIGLFVNTLALRLDLSGSPSVSQLLEQTKAQSLAAQRHQDIPFEQVVELLQPVRSLAHSPLFQVMFAWQNAEARLELPGLEVLLLQPPNKAAQFDLTLFLQLAGDTTSGAIEYASALFEAATVHRYMGYFLALLKAMVADDAQTIDRLPMLSEEEREQVLYGWNETKAEFPSEKCVHELFEEQVARTPQAVAVIYEEERLSYGELNERANRLAHYLRELGVKPDEWVAICVERGFEMIVGLLAILKAGGAYVPLDPGYPEERLRYMVEDSGAKVVLTQAHLRGLFAGLSPEAAVVEMGGGKGEGERTEWADHAEKDLDRKSVGVGGRDLAYVIYTSGSTGRPKGVMVEHGGVCNYLRWARGAYGVKQALVSSSLSFDATVTSLYGGLLGGGGVKMVKEGEEIEGVYEQMRGGEWGLVKATPGHVEAVGQRLEEAGEQSGPGVLVIGGEALPAGTVELWKKAGPEVRVINEYGPTETVVGCTVYEVSGEEEWVGGRVPIGKPIANARIYLLDEWGEPVGVGVRGELYIGGAGVARGYLNRPELTAERFLPDPYGGQAGGRMYRSGDQGRWLRSGELEYLGRNDDQVKVRSYRIELGEIEARLREHEGVGEAVVVVREEEGGDKRLVAYYTERGGASAGGAAAEAVAEKPVGVAVEELRRHLRERLPEYMVPTAYVQLEKIPLTPNGKIDRKSLPEPDKDIREQEYVGPRSVTEETLCRLWQEVLRRERVGIHDNFFNIGGHSLLAVQLISRIRQAFTAEMPLSILFAAPTVARMAEHIAAVNEPDRSPSPSVLVNIQPHGSRAPFFCVHAVGGQVISYAELSQELGLEQPFYGLQSPPATYFPESGVSIEQLATFYNQEIRSVQPRGPYLLSGWSMGGLVAWEMAQQLRKEGESISLLALIDTAPPPKYREAEDRADEISMLARFAMDMSRLVGRDPGPLVEQFLQAAEQDQWKMVQETLTSFGVLAPKTAHAEMTALLDVFTRNFRAMNNYSIPTSKQAVVYFRASETAERFSKVWTKWSGGGIQFHSVPGDHFTMLRRPGVHVIAETLQRYLSMSNNKSRAVSPE